MRERAQPYFAGLDFGSQCFEEQTQTALRWELPKFARPPFGMAYRAQAILQGRYTPTPLIVPSQRFRFYAVEQSPFNVRKSEKFMDKGGRVLLSAGLLDGESRSRLLMVPTRKVILMNLVIPSAARNLPEHMSRQPSVQARIPAQSRFLASLGMTIRLFL
jgi:hypothetical protein